MFTIEVIFQCFGDSRLGKAIIFNIIFFSFRVKMLKALKIRSKRKWLRDDLAFSSVFILTTGRLINLELIFRMVNFRKFIAWFSYRACNYRDDNNNIKFLRIKINYRMLRVSFKTQNLIASFSILLLPIKWYIHQSELNWLLRFIIKRAVYRETV